MKILHISIFPMWHIPNYQIIWEFDFLYFLPQTYILSALPVFLLLILHHKSPQPSCFCQLNPRRTYLSRENLCTLYIYIDLPSLSSSLLGLQRDLPAGTSWTRFKNHQSRLRLTPWHQNKLWRKALRQSDRCFRNWPGNTRTPQLWVVTSLLRVCKQSRSLLTCRWMNWR